MIKKIFCIFFGSLAACLFCAASVCGQVPDSTAAGKSDTLPQAAPTPQTSAGGWGEVTFHAGGGLSTLLYSLSQGSRSLGTGGDVGLGYHVFPSRHFGVGTGVGVALFRASATLKNLHGVTPNLVSEDGELYDMHTDYINHAEKQRATFIRIPVMLHYRTFWRRPLYAQAGLSVYLPLSTRYEVSNAAITSKGYFHRYDNWATFPSYLGFGDFAVPSAADELPLKPVFTASAEAGIRWQLRNLPLAVYTNLYVDCGLNSAKNDAQREKLLWSAETSPSDFKVGSMVNTRFEPEKSFTGKVTLLSAGVRVRIALGRQQRVIDSRQPGRQGVPPADELLAKDRLRLTALRDSAIRAELESSLREQTRRRMAILREAERYARGAPGTPSQKAKDSDAKRKKTAALLSVVDGYDINSTVLSPAAKAVLDAQAENLKRHPERQVLLEGHACKVGSMAANKAIGQRRAEVVKRYLVSKGVAAKRISIASQGSTRPVAPNTGEKNRKKNRRVEIKEITAAHTKIP